MIHTQNLGKGHPMSWQLTRATLIIYSKSRLSLYLQAAVSSEALKVLPPSCIKSKIYLPWQQEPST